MRFENIYEDVSVLRPEDYQVLERAIQTADAVDRCEIAALLAGFVQPQSKALLLSLGRDEDPVVRAEAYDSLAAFPFSDVETFLRNSAETERDALARAYAILSLADVRCARQTDLPACREVFLKLLARETDAQCRLSLHRALCLFEAEDSLPPLLAFLREDNYQLRCAAVTAARDVLTVENRETITRAIRSLLQSETTRAVLSRVEAVWGDLTEDGETQCGN